MSDRRELRDQRLLSSYERSGVFLFQETYGRLVKLAASRGVGTSDAEDIAQSALEALLTLRPVVERPEAWLMRVVVRRCFDQRRRARVEVHVLAREQAALETVNEFHIDPWQIRRLLAACRKLPKKMQILIRSRYVLGHDEATAASLAGYSAGSFKKVMTRTLARLRAALRAE